MSTGLGSALMSRGINNSRASTSWVFSPDCFASSIYEVRAEQGETRSEMHCVIVSLSKET
jgi:hypothetical protein